MGAAERTKGAVGEREVAKLLSEELGNLVQRKLGAARDGGSDIELPGWAIEIKRTEQWISDFWTQTVWQADREKKKPALIWRKSRSPWMVWIDLHHVNAEIWPRRGDVARLTIKAFCQLVRETQ